MLEKLKARIAGARKSFTIWFNGIAGAFIIFLPDAQASFPQLREYIPTNIYSFVMAALIFGNIALRFKTIKDLADK